jgi:hypothetical protein
MLQELLTVASWLTCIRSSLSEYVSVAGYLPITSTFAALSELLQAASIHAAGK